MQTLAELIERSSQAFSSQVAFQIKAGSSYRQINFSQTLELAQKIQAKLLDLGVKKGDRVALLSENRPEWPLAYLAIVGMGAIVVPLDAMLTREEILPLLDDCGASLILLSQKFIDFVAGHTLENKKLFLEDIPNFEYRIANSEFRPSPDDVAAIVYTSGTTGLAKGVTLTHKNIVSNVLAVASLFDLGPKDNFLSVLPLYHTFETTAGFLAPFYCGCTVTYSESLKSYHLLTNMQETGVTVICGVPLLYRLFYDGIRREVEEKKLEKVFSLLFFISGLVRKLIGINIGRLLFKTVHKKFGGKIRFFVSGGAAIDPALINNFDLMGFTILQGYGLSESAPILSCNTLKSNKIGSVGKVLPGVELKIAGTDPVGEILAFGPNIMKGYYRKKELTSRVVINGWLYTGDVGYLDEEGFLFITGRSKDVIVTPAGVNVYPEEIEAALNKYPEVKESAVLGSDQVFAVIVSDASLEAIAELVKRFNSRVAEFKRIAKFVVRREELPKTRLKKIKKFELKKELEL